jgi:hypothetical protein
VATKPSPAPTPIPLSEIATQMESTVGSVQSIETTLSSDQITAIVEKRLPPLTREIGLRGTEMAKFLAGSVPLELLHSMEIVLRAYRDELSSWNHDLMEHAKILEATTSRSGNGRFTFFLAKSAAQHSAPKITQNNFPIFHGI